MQDHNEAYHSPEITQLREDLALALRAAAHHGLAEGVCNHFSLELPDQSDRFLLNPRGLLWQEIAPDDRSIYSKETMNVAPLSLIVGLICANVINSMIKTKEVGLKWPNDIILAKKKIGGILIEKEVMGTNINNIAGIGINLNHPEKEEWWGDLTSFKVSSMRNELINGILKSYIHFCDNGIESWEEKWHELCVHMNLNIKIRHNDKIIETGIFDGINADGSLKLKLSNNKIINYEHGEISIEGIY